MGNKSKNHPGIIAPPPLIYIAGMALMFFLNRRWPAPIFPESFSDWIGILIIVLGIAFNLWGASSMSQAKTPINPYKTVTTVVSSGAFRFSRNPLYVGIDLIFLGLIYIINTYWGGLAFALVLLVMHFGVIRREERYLSREFGEKYSRYRDRVRRYL